LLLKDKNILLISPEAWEHIFVSKHHYATHLAKRGNKVYFLNPPSNQFSVSKTGFRNVYSVQYKGFSPGIRFYPKFIQRYLIKHMFQELERLCKSRFNIIWSFDNSVFYDFSSFPVDLTKILHVVDFNQDFQLKAAAETADVCFGVSTPIMKKLKAFNKQAFFINHGCGESLGEKKVTLPGANRTKAFYVGNLDIHYLDWGLFKEIIYSNREVDFIIAGPWSEGGEKEVIQSFSNVHYVGQLKAVELSRFYNTVDLLLLLYRANEFPEQLSNPHKMMEYLASGKMIIATRTQEYLDLAGEGLFLMAEENKEFPQLFQSAILDLEYWNSKQKQKDRQAYALENTYNKQIEKIEAFLRPLL
jgi:glycosyltransferase involved in cell wall biosynthesis